MYSKNNLHEAREKIGSAPSVLLEALAILPGKDSLAITLAALVLLNHAFRHCKFIGWTEDASALVAVCGLAGADDEGFCTLAAAASVQTFADACKTMRRWAREALFQL